MEITFTIGSWIIPLIGTIGTFLYSYIMVKRSPNRDFGPNKYAIFHYGSSTIVTVVIWSSWYFLGV